MIVYTDNIDFATKYFNEIDTKTKITYDDIPMELRILAYKLIHKEFFYCLQINSITSFQYCFCVEYSEESQFDLLVESSQSIRNLPDGIICLAGKGKKFHGSRDRKWVSVEGNIHLSIYFAPQKMIDHFNTGFVVLAANSVVQTIDKIDGLYNKSGIKWVNDVLISNYKVCGVLAHSQIQGSKIVSAILGIGLNVENIPIVEPTPFVPQSASLNKFLPTNKQANQGDVFRLLIDKLKNNYELLCNNKYFLLLEFYRNRSIIYNKQAVIWSDTNGDISEELIHGTVTLIGDDLELYFDDNKTPITTGRLISREI